MSSTHGRGPFCTDSEAMAALHFKTVCLQSRAPAASSRTSRQLFIETCACPLYKPLSAPHLSFIQLAGQESAAGVEAWVSLWAQEGRLGSGHDSSYGCIPVVLAQQLLSWCWLSRGAWRSLASLPRLHFEVKEEEKIKDGIAGVQTGNCARYGSWKASIIEGTWLSRTVSFGCKERSSKQE